MGSAPQLQKEQWGHPCSEITQHFANSTRIIEAGLMCIKTWACTSPLMLGFHSDALCFLWPFSNVRCSGIFWLHPVWSSPSSLHLESQRLASKSLGPKSLPDPTIKSFQETQLEWRDISKETPRRHSGNILALPKQFRWQINNKHLRLDVLKKNKNKNQVINFPLCLSSQSTDGKFKLHLIHPAEERTTWSYTLAYSTGFHFPTLSSCFEDWIKSPISLVSCCFVLSSWFMVKGPGQKQPQEALSLSLTVKPGGWIIES